MIQDGNRGNKEKPTAGRRVADYNTVKRERYRTDAEVRNKQMQYSRDSYRMHNPRREKPITRDASLAVAKEVITDDMDEPQVVRVLTMSRAAEYLNCNIITLRKWIADELIPAPILYDLSHGYVHYSIGELDVIARVLEHHRQEFDYYLVAHTQTTHMMFQAIQGYRANYL